MYNLPETNEAITSFIAAFENGTLPKEQWSHAAHVLGGAWYVHELGEEAALDHMRARVRFFNESVGGKNTDTSGYHETITVLWIKVLAELKREMPEMDRVAFTNAAVARYASERSLHERYYSFNVLKSTDARLRWVKPDLMKL